MSKLKTSLRVLIASLMVAGPALPAFASDEAVYYFRSHGQVTSGAIHYSVSLEGTKDEVFSKPLPSNGGGFSFVVSGGALPQGISFDVSSQSFIGTPTSVGSFSINLTGTRSIDDQTATASVSFKINDTPVAPGQAVPDIADQSKAVIGVSRTEITDWLPKAPAQWSASVVDKESREPWSHESTVFTASEDLTQFGLQFDAATGAISGTPTAPFIIDDFTITVTSKDGLKDTTAPFWIGVAPSSPLAIDATQNDVYVFRLGSPFSTDPISVTGTIGDVSFSSPVQISTGWDSATGVWSQDGTGQTQGSVSQPVSYETTVTDEFDRSLQWSFIADFAVPLAIPPLEVIAYYDTTYTEEEPLATLTATGLLGSPTWTASDLPIGLEYDETTGKITGAVSTTSLYADGQSFEAPLTLQDSYDDSEAEGEAVIIARIKETLDTAMQVSAGDRHTCALKPEGSVWCWGRNTSGQIGNGTTSTAVLSPAQVVGMETDVAVVSAGNVQTCVIKTDRSVWCWGSTYGNSPVVIPAAANARSVSAFGDRICAVKVDGNVWCWTVGTTPTQVMALSNVQSVATGVGYSCAVTADQNVWCWGAGANGVLGNGSSVNQSSPVQVVGLPASGSGVVKIDAGWSHTCAISRNGQTYCWGLNNRGQLGTGDTTSHDTAVLMQGVGPASRISLGYQYTCLALKSGAAACVGYGEQGKLGRGSNSDALLPITPTGLGSRVVDVAIGGAQSVAMMSDSSLSVWGRNTSGELGLGNTTGSNVPIPLSFGD